MASRGYKIDDEHKMASKSKGYIRLMSIRWHPNDKMASRRYKIDKQSIRWHQNDRINMNCFLERIKAEEVPKQPLASPLIAWPDLADLKKYMNIDVVSHWFSKQTRKRVRRNRAKRSIPKPKRIKTSVPKPKPSKTERPQAETERNGGTRSDQ